MDGDRPQASDRLQVLPRRVPLVAGEAVPRVEEVVLRHHPVPRHLREDRRGRDGDAPVVAAHARDSLDDRILELLRDCRTAEMTRERHVELPVKTKEKEIVTKK